jgi:hypothetical protein
MRLHQVLFILCTLLFATSVNAEKLPGADAPELAQAVTAWLNDDDRGSLPALAKLAAKGNVAAAMLVARIERTTKFATPYVRSLSRRDRLRLFRRPSNYVFAPGWINWYADKGLDLAIAIEDAGLSRTDSHLAYELVDLGERQAADSLIRRIVFYGNGQQQAQIISANLLPELDPYLTAMSWPGTNSRLGLNALVHLVGDNALDNVAQDEIDRAAGFLHNGMPFHTLPAGSPLHSAIAQRISEVPALQPIYNQCQSICPNDVEQCSVAMMGLHGGYYDSIRIDSPLESVINQPRFLASRRASAIALRRAALARDGAATLRASVESIWIDSQCLAAAVGKIRLASGDWFR